MQSEWKKFEEAVAAFVQALDRRAIVKQNVRLPDKDTGRPRQRDVWIDTSYGGHFPISILVSCKREGDKLDQQDIDAFVGELRSSGAHVGVLYSYSGYTAPALEKARILGICCCSLYENSPPDIPEVLKFAAFCFTERVRLILRGNVSTNNTKLSDLLDQPSEAGNASVVQSLVNLHNERRDEVLKRISATAPYPSTWQSEVLVPITENTISIILEGSWNIYQAKMDSWLLNGSYSFINNDFKGSVTTPYVDRFSSHPGPGWETIETDCLPIQKGMMSFILHSSDLIAQIQTQFGTSLLSDFG